MLGGNEMVGGAACLGTNRRPKTRNRGVMSSEPQNEYEGDVTAREAYEILKREPRAQLVDVRTRPEWSFVGTPDLTSAGKEALLAEWQLYPSMEVSPRFV